MAILEPVRTKRTILQAKAVAGSVEGDPGSWSAADSIAIYDAFNPIQADIEVQELNRARATLDPDGVIIGIPTYKLAGKVFLYGNGVLATGYANEAALPPFYKLMIGAGMGVTVGTGEATFLPLSDTMKKLYFRVWLDKYQHESEGARGNVVISGEAGSPVEMTFDYTGAYKKASNTQSGDLDDVATPPGNPPRLCGIDSLRLLAYQSDGTVFTPDFKSFSLDFGVTTTIRKSGNKANCLTEVAILQEYRPRLSTVIEVQDYSTNLDEVTIAVFDFIEAMNQGDLFAYEINVGPYTNGSLQGRRWTFTNSDDTTVDTGLAAHDFTVAAAQLSRAPQYSDDGGVRTYELEFLLTGTNNNMHRVIAR